MRHPQSEARAAKEVQAAPRTGLYGFGGDLKAKLLAN